jgi:hypothetical protein
MLREILKSTLVQVILQIVLLIGGFWLLLASSYNWISFGTSDYALWNRRIVIFLAIAMISLSIAIMYPTSRTQNPLVKVWVFGLSFVIFAGVLFAIGGSIGVFSAVAEDTRGYNAQNFWIGFDAGTDIGLGVNVWLIADAIAYIFPIIVLTISIIQLYYAGEADEYLKALLEGAVGLGFMLVYAMWIVPAFR